MLFLILGKVWGSLSLWKLKIERLKGVRPSGEKVVRSVYGHAGEIHSLFNTTATFLFNIY